MLYLPNFRPYNLKGDPDNFLFDEALAEYSAMIGTTPELLYALASNIAGASDENRQDRVCQAIISLTPYSGAGLAFGRVMKAVAAAWAFANGEGDPVLDPANYGSAEDPVNRQRVRRIFLDGLADMIAALHPDMKKGEITRYHRWFKYQNVSFWQWGEMELYPDFGPSFVYLSNTYEEIASRIEKYGFNR